MHYQIDADNTDPNVTITVYREKSYSKTFRRTRDGDLWEVPSACCRWLEKIGVDESSINSICWDAEHTGEWFRPD